MRFAFLIVSNIFVFVVLGLLLNQTSDENSDLGPEDLSTFQTMALIVCGTGLVFSAIFHIGVREKKIEKIETQPEIGQNIEEKVIKRDLTAMDWLKGPIFT